MQTKNAPKNEAMYKKYPIVEEIFQKMSDLQDTEQQLTKIMIDVFKPGQSNPEDIKFLYSLFLTVDHFYEKNKERSDGIIRLLNQLMAIKFSKEDGEEITPQEMAELARKVEKEAENAMKKENLWPN